MIEEKRKSPSKNYFSVEHSKTLLYSIAFLMKNLIFIV